MMTKEAIISNTFLTAVGNAVAAVTPVLPVQNPGIPFDVPNGGQYVEVIQIRNNPSGEYYGDERTYMGILRLLVHWPNDKAGEIPALTYLDALAAQFPKGSLMLYDVPEIGSVVEDQGQRFYPLTLRYRQFSPQG